MTPPRLTELECPACHATKWVIDCDSRDDDEALGYPERSYSCARCGSCGPGWSVLQQSPPEFLLQPHDLYPMTQVEFDRWVAILRANFPQHPKLARLGTTFFPRTPQQAAPEQRANPPVECPACGETMVDTGKREMSDITHQPMRIMWCPRCRNEGGVSRSAGRPR